MTDGHRGASTGAIDLVALEPAFLEPVLRSYLARQPWFDGDEGAARLSSGDILWRKDGELGPALVWALVEVAGPRYQALVGVSHETAGLRCGEQDPALLGPLAGGYLAYDALADSELSLALLEVVSGGRERASLVRQVVGGERSRMTCLAYDDRVMVKLYRRLRADLGHEPDVEVTEALDRVGFNHLAAPMACWRREGRDLAMVQEFLAGGTEGWSLALTSLRDLYAGAAAPADGSPPAADAVAGAGGDFGAEARRLGEMTARLHLALAAAFGVEPGRAADWAERAQAGLDRLAGKGALPEAVDLDGARSALGRMADLEDPGAAIRPHGDYHLGQVMRTAMGWFVLDFEGAPEHLEGGPPARCSPMWDVVGMLHSFRYAAAEARQERGPEESAGVVALERAWEQRNRAAFLQGYLSTPEVATLLPPRQASFEAVLVAHSLEQAALELDSPGPADRAVVASEELERLSGGDGRLSVP